MLLRIASLLPLPGAAIAAALLLLGIGMGGCADMNDTMLSAFADPAQFDLYDCKQLEDRRKYLATRQAELQGLMAKADTGVAGPVVAELAYRNEYISVRAQIRNADLIWVRDKCRPSTPVAGAPATPVPVAPANAKGPPSKSGSAVY
jgi:hypothetical protein